MSYLVSQKQNSSKTKKSVTVSVKNKDIFYECDMNISKRKYRYWLDKWLKTKKTVVKESTYIRYMNIIENHIKPKLGNKILEEIDRYTIEKFILHEKEFGRLNGEGGLSSKTVSDFLLIIKSSLKYAQSFGVIVDCNFCELPLRKENNEMRVLSIHEENKLLKIITNNVDTYKLGVILCLYTGIRLGELCALKWKNVSIDEKTIKIDSTMQRIQGADTSSLYKTHISITKPKSFSSIRIIPLPDFLVEMIKPFEKNGNDFFLSNEHKTFVEPRTMQNYLKKYILESNIEKANFHSLRHTFATRCIEKGFDIKTLSEILGHSNVKMTLDKYVHSSMQLKRINMNKLTLEAL